MPNDYVTSNAASWFEKFMLGETRIYDQQRKKIDDLKEKFKNSNAYS